MNELVEKARQRALDVLKPTEAQLEHGLELHRELPVCDSFSFLPQVWAKDVVEKVAEMREQEIGARQWAWESQMLREIAATRDVEAGKEFLDAIETSGLTCLVQTVAEGKSREQDIKRMAGSVHNCRHFRKHLFQAGSAREVHEAKKEGRTCVIWSVNGPPCPGHMIEAEEELSWIQTWHNLGVRLMHLTYNRRNIVGDGCAEPANGGLSHFGRDLVRKMNEVGIIVDTSHSGKQTTLDAAHLSARPMVASHTACEAVFEHIRCKSDEELKAIAETDGLMGVYVLPNMLGPDATIATMLDHLDHAAKVIGTDHISIGTDTTYAAPWPNAVKGFPNARFNSQWWGAWDPEVQARYRSDEARSGSLAWTNWPIFTVGLVTRGYSDEDIKKIVGGNLLRVLEANEPGGAAEK